MDMCVIHVACAHVHISYIVLVLHTHQFFPTTNLFSVVTPKHRVLTFIGEPCPSYMESQDDLQRVGGD